jgi:hypothetical protein
MVVGSHINAEVVAHGPDVLRAAEQAGTMGAVLTLQAMLVKKLAELVDMLRIQVAIRSHAPFGAHIVNREFHRHQTKARSSTLMDSGSASRAVPTFLRTLREGSSLAADLLEGMSTNISRRKAMKKENQ